MKKIFKAKITSEHGKVFKIRLYRDLVKVGCLVISIPKFQECAEFIRKNNLTARRPEIDQEEVCLRHNGDVYYCCEVISRAVSLYIINKIEAILNEGEAHVT